MFPSTLSSIAVLITKAVDSYGCDSGALFSEVGLDKSRLFDANARYPYHTITRLWQLAARVTGDPCFGLRAARFWHPTTLHALGYSFLASATLKDAVERVTRYVRVVNTHASVELMEAHHAFELHVGTKNVQPPADEAMDAAVAILVGLLRTSSDQPFAPLQVDLRRPRPTCAEHIERQLDTRVRYDCPELVVYLDKQALLRQLPTANAELARANDEIVMRYLADLDIANVAGRAQARLLDLLPSGNSSEATMARSLNMSLRTLQRRLRDEGTSYKEVLDQTRRQLAYEYIRDSKVSITEMAYLLGFSDANNFSRAFKRWQGMAPTAYRQAM